MGHHANSKIIINKTILEYTKLLKTIKKLLKTIKKLLLLLLFKVNVPRDDLNDDFQRNTRAFARPNLTPAAQAISVTHRRCFNVGDKRVSVDDFKRNKGSHEGLGSCCPEN